MPNKINLLRFLIVVLFFSSIAIATETTWRHSGFEISGYDINGSSTYNLTEIRKIEFGWNTSIPAVSETNRAVMYYDDNQKQIMQSVNGGAYQAIVTNETVRPYSYSAANATDVLPNGSIPLSAANLSANNAFTGSGNTSFAGNVGIGTTGPSQILDIVGTGNRYLFDSATTAAFTSTTYRNNTGQTTIRGQYSRGTAASPLVVQSGDTAFEVIGAGMDANSGTFWDMGSLKFEVDGTPGASDMPGRITFWTVDDGTTTQDERMRITNAGNVGIGNTTPANILAFAVGSATDPIADSWLQYSTPESKIVLGEADNLTEKYRADFRNTTVYRWKRTANEPERLGVLAKEGTPPEILAYHDGKNNTNNTALNATPQGIDLGAYIGWLHEVVKGQDMQLQRQEKEINYLYKQLNMTKP